MHALRLATASLLLIGGAGVPAAVRAATLEPGQIAVVGRSYGGQPAGACDGRVCIVDVALSSVLPASDALAPELVAGVSDLAIESRTGVWVLAAHAVEEPPFTAALLRVDLVTGAAATVASGVPIGVLFEDLEFPAERSVAAARGRVFVSGRDGILEIDRDDGAVSVLAPGVYDGLDVEPGGGSLLTARRDPAELCGTHEFVRIDLASGAATPLGELHHDCLTFLDVAPGGDRFLYSRSGGVFDGQLTLWRPSGETLLWGGEEYQASVRGIASDLDGNLLVGADGHPDPDNIYRLIEIERWQPAAYPSHVVLAQLDGDFSVEALDVAPVFAPVCDDGLDNDGDGSIDWNGANGAPLDPQCNGDPSRATERAASCGLGAELAFVLAAARAARRRQRLG